ncbi:MAG: YraN family protein [Candidatus Omnitrophica bacterium]|nr:YraN family protein [Candidatus Omnitrophota bacterium]MBU4345972.1 YraN family protein [Candidatus Omnitrophota bacterium]MBU4472808.1 YraN family protein [Candidatus Omnitrophota bacterium]MCG2706001.1 YraN family protein [Candidatus Omnitrophota bacterium]
MPKAHLYLGRAGEEVAISLLKKNDYKILAKNYKTKLGEIDIIAKDKDTFCFIEVKTRNSDRFGLPAEAISDSKQRHIARAALIFLKENNLLDKKARFDVVSVIYSEKYRPRLDLIKNAFELDARYAT